MFAHALSLLQTLSPSPSPSAQPVPDGSFQAVLAQVDPLQAPVSAADEAEAMKQLFHLVSWLYVGLVDPTALAPDEPAPGTQAGPARREVEELKAVLRQLLQLSGGRPTHARHKAGGMDLMDYLKSLPTDLQNLLKRAFPDLEQLARQEAEREAKALARTLAQP
jgi:hypothetical protein